MSGAECPPSKRCLQGGINGTHPLPNTGGVSRGQAWTHNHQKAANESSPPGMPGTRRQLQRGIDNSHGEGEAGVAHQSTTTGRGFRGFTRAHVAEATAGGRASCLHALAPDGHSNRGSCVAKAGDRSGPSQGSRKRSPPSTTVASAGTSDAVEVAGTRFAFLEGANFRRALCPGMYSLSRQAVHHSPKEEQKTRNGSTVTKMEATPPFKLSFGLI